MVILILSLREVILIHFTEEQTEIRNLPRTVTNTSAKFVHHYM